MRKIDFPGMHECTVTWGKRNALFHQVGTDFHRLKEHVASDKGSIGEADFVVAVPT